MNNHPSPDIRRKRLLWRASHRGIKEMDLLIGGYAAAHLARLTDTEMNQFEIILEVPDQDLLAWLTGQAEVPAQHATPLLLDILKFRPTLTS